MGPSSAAGAAPVRRPCCRRTVTTVTSSAGRPCSVPGVKAIQIVELSGPDTALALVDMEEPEASHSMTPGSGVVVDVHAAGVSVPQRLQTRGEYQIKPPLPFVPGSEVGGVVRSAPEGASVRAGDRVAAFCMLGAWAETTVAPEHFVFKLPDELDFAQGAALVLNYHTAYFSLVTRGQLSEGETVLVHGAAGGVGTASIQVAKGLGARTIAVVSSDEKERIARDAGADEVVRSDGEWKDQAKDLSGGGVDVVVDPVGGDRFTDSLRALREGGRLVVVGQRPVLAAGRVGQGAAGVGGHGRRPGDPTSVETVVERGPRGLGRRQALGHVRLHAAHACLIHL